MFIVHLLLVALTCFVEGRLTGFGHKPGLENARGGLALSRPGHGCSDSNMIAIPEHPCADSYPHASLPAEML